MWRKLCSLTNKATLWKITGGKSHGDHKAVLYKPSGVHLAIAGQFDPEKSKYWDCSHFFSTGL